MTKKVSGLSDIPMKEDPALRRMKAEEALGTISRASEHAKDKALMREVRRLAKEKVKHYSNFAK